MSLVQLKTELRQELKRTPQLLQSMEVLQMTSQELLAYIGRMAEENPLLDQSDPPEAAYEELRRQALWIDGGLGSRATFTHEETALEPGREDRDLESGVVSVALPEHMPTAFVCNCDNTAGVLYDRLAEAGLRVPEDVSVTGYDDYLFNHVFSSSLTTYHVDMEEMARLAVKLLLRQVRKKEGGRGVRYVDGFMVERGSVKNMEEA